MIRVFTIFCKLNFKFLSVKDLFFVSMKEFTAEKLPFLKLRCPFCGAKNPSWEYHDSYSRYLIGFENNVPVSNIIDITRIICSSCKHPHAILPEIIIPYSSYSLTFVLSALRDYFSKMKIMDICEKYQISISLIYAWKLLFLQHKKLWLGILDDMYHHSSEFLSSIPTFTTSNDLRQFFTQNGYSFLQRLRKTALSDSS
jgi:hypothetical protein